MLHSSLQKPSQIKGNKGNVPGLQKERCRNAFVHANAFSGLHSKPHAHRHANVARVQAEQSSQAAESKSEPSTSGRPVVNYSQDDLKDYEHVIGTEEFRSLGYKVVDFIADYYKGLEEGRHQVKPNIKPGFLNGQLPSSPPENPEPWADIFEDFKSKLMPGVLHWQAPSFYGYFPANSSYPGMLADWLASASNMIGFSWAAGPVSTELEMLMMDWLGQLLGMPSKFLYSSGGPGGGVIQGTSSEAVLVALLAARARTLRGRPKSDALNLVAYSSDQAHSAFKKACMIVGINHVRVLPTRAEDDYALQPSVLQSAIEEDVTSGLLPCYLCATIGTTSSCAVDPVGDLACVGRSAATGPVWSHVDAAYAGSAAVCPEQRAMHFQGLEELDSYSFNPHKWMLTNFDCCAMWTADAAPVKEALSLTPVFLQATGNALDLKDLQIPLGRRFRSLKLLFVMRCYGADRLRAYIRHHCALAAWFAEKMQEDSRFELAAPQRFGLVCFRLAGVPNEVNKALLDALNASGDMFLIHTELSGKFTIRLAVGSTGTQLRHVEHVWQVVQQEAWKLLGAK